MISKSKGIVMRKNSKSSGSVMVLGLFLLLILSGLLAAVSPMIINELKFSTINRDAIEAQFAAEAGAKVALEALYKEQNRDWSWVYTDANPVVNQFDAVYPTDKKKYKVTLSRADGVVPAVTNGQLAKGNMVFTIVSEGTVGIEKRTVTVKAKTSLSSVLNYAIYSENGNTTMNTATVTGKVATRKTLITNNKSAINGTATASILDVPAGVITGTTYCNSSVDATRCDQTMPTIGPLIVSDLSVPMPVFPPAGAISHNGNTNINTPTVDVVIAVQGGGYSLNGKSIIGKNITIHAKGSIELLQNSTIQAASGGTVSLYADGGSVILDNGSQLLGSEVVVIAKRSDSASTFSFNGGTINYNNPNSKTKIYSYGNVSGVNAKAVIGSTMSAFIMATATASALGTISANSANLNNTMLIGQGSVDVSGGTYAGIYSQNAVTLNKDTIVTYKASNATALDLPFAIRSWGL
jgi:hypothetical protein